MEVRVLGAIWACPRTPVMVNFCRVAGSVPTVVVVSAAPSLPMLYGVPACSGRGASVRLCRLSAAFAKLLPAVPHAHYRETFT